MKDASTNTIWALFFSSCVAKRGGGVSCRCVISIKAAEAGESGQLSGPKCTCDGFMLPTTLEPEAGGLSNIRRLPKPKERSKGRRRRKERRGRKGGREVGRRGGVKEEEQKEEGGEEEEEEEVVEDEEGEGGGGRGEGRGGENNDAPPDGPKCSQSLAGLPLPKLLSIHLIQNGCPLSSSSASWCSSCSLSHSLLTYTVSISFSLLLL